MSEGTGIPEDRIVAEGVDRMAHQLKNPLQAITVNLEVLRLMATKSVGPDELEEVERLAGVVNESVRTLVRRIDLLVALARRSERDEPARRVRLGRVVREAAGAFRLDEREHGHGLELELPPGEEDPEVRVGVGWLAALLLRAVAAAQDTGGRLRVRVTSMDEDGLLEFPAVPDPESGTPEARGALEGLAELARRAGGEPSPGQEGLSVRFPGG